MTGARSRRRRPSPEPRLPGDDTAVVSAPARIRAAPGVSMGLVQWLLEAHGGGITSHGADHPRATSRPSSPISSRPGPALENRASSAPDPGTGGRWEALGGDPLRAAQVSVASESCSDPVADAGVPAPSSRRLSQRSARGHSYDPFQRTARDSSGIPGKTQKITNSVHECRRDLVLNVRYPGTGRAPGLRPSLTDRIGRHPPRASAPAPKPRSLRPFLADVVAWRRLPAASRAAVCSLSRLPADTHRDHPRDLRRDRGVVARPAPRRIPAALRPLAGTGAKPVTPTRYLLPCRPRRRERRTSASDQRRLPHGRGARLGGARPSTGDMRLVVVHVTAASRGGRLSSRAPSPTHMSSWRTRISPSHAHAATARATRLGAEAHFGSSEALRTLVALAYEQDHLVDSTVSARTVGVGPGAPQTQLRWRQRPIGIGQRGANGGAAPAP